MSRGGLPYDDNVLYSGAVMGDLGGDARVAIGGGSTSARIPPTTYTFYIWHGPKERAKRTGAASKAFERMHIHTSIFRKHRVPAVDAANHSNAPEDTCAHGLTGGDRDEAVVGAGLGDRTGSLAGPGIAFTLEPRSHKQASCKAATTINST